MTRRLSRLSAVIGATAALSVAGIGVAQAKNGADDPVAHKAGHHKQHRSKHLRHGQGRDDGPNHVRHGGDDGLNHT